MAKNFKIVDIDAEGVVEVIFNVDGSTKRLSKLTVSDKETLYNELREYGKAYEAGLAKAVVVIDPKIEKNKNIAIEV